MIYTVTMNPAIDKTIILKDLKVDGINRVDEIREDAGGKGINVSKMIKNLNGQSVALGIIAGSNGAFIKIQLDLMEIKHDFIEADGNTRTNIKIVDIKNKTYTDINENGIHVSKEILHKIQKQIFDLIKEEDILVLSGSVPASVDKDIYKKWVENAKEINVKTIVDADGELLKNAVLAGPYLIKPNIHELEMLFGQSIEYVDKAIELASTLLQYGTKVIVISRGDKGCIVITKEKTLIVDAIKVDAKSTVGAGDSMVGALAHALENGKSIEEAIALGVAASTSSVKREGTVMGDLDEILLLKNKVVISEYKKEQ